MPWSRHDLKGKTTLQPVFKLLHHQILPDFPSGSALSFYQDRLYLAGDDAKHLLLLDKEHLRTGSVPLIDYPGNRIPKKIKPDFETSTVIRRNGEDHLLLFGSASKKRRALVMLISLGSGDPNVEGPLYWETGAHELMRWLGLDKVNIEGAAAVGQHMLLSSRASADRPQNYLIVTDVGFWETMNPKGFSLPLRLPDNRQGLGISELCHDNKTDTLLLTLTSEGNASAYDDGPIGDSYLAWIFNISKKLGGDHFQLDGSLSLASADEHFSKEKIEGICIESSQGSNYILHLVSDNDQGESRLFRIEFSLPTELITGRPSLD